MLALEYTGQQRDAYPYSVPEVLFFNTWPGYSAKNFLRKTSSDFGWDWGPAFIPQGIIRDVVLFKSAVGELSDVLVSQTPRADGSVLVAATALVHHVPGKGEAWLSLELEGSGAPAVVNKKVALVAGENEVGVVFVLGGGGGMGSVGLWGGLACRHRPLDVCLSDTHALSLLHTHHHHHHHHHHHLTKTQHPPLPPTPFPFHTHAHTPTRQKTKNKQFTESFVIKDPELWWPVGLGSPHLYKLRVKLSHVGSNEGQTKVGGWVGMLYLGGGCCYLMDAPLTPQPQRPPHPSHTHTDQERRHPHRAPGGGTRARLRRALLLL
jgi:hypothetical protein